MTEYSFSIPTSSEPLAFKLTAGESVFVVGSNGAGKSSLMHRLYTMHSQHCLRISAHRQTWFTSDSLELSPQAKRQTEQNIKSRDSSPESRWKDDMAAARANIAIYELIDAENVRARAIAGAVDNDSIDEAKRLASNDAPITIINELLELAGLPIEISVHENERILAVKKGSVPYSIAELSDGERNALLIAAAILTAKEGLLILIDEPERHLHRSIISPLLTHLFARRNDCAFVISTHEVLLPVDHKEAKTLLVRSCSYQGNSVSSWDIDIISGADDIPENIKLDILGSRRRILFIEGTKESLDKPLYGILFPDVTVVPKGNCREVEQSVVGVRNSADLHWAEAYGIIDNDGRSSEESGALKEKGIFAIDCYSIESLYYHPLVIELVANRMASIDGSDAIERIRNATASAIEQLEPHRDRLCRRIATRKLREFVSRNMPDTESITDRNDITIQVPISEFMQKEEAIFDEAISSGDYVSLLYRYPLRETPALGNIAKNLGFCNRKQYEAAVLKMCSDDVDSRDVILGLLGDISESLSPAG